MNDQIRNESWRVRLFGSRVPWASGAIRPADVAEGLCSASVARENLLEDVNYQKIAPNQFVVEIEQDNYTQNYRPLEQHILQQWKDKLLSHLMTVNNRQGRHEYSFAGPIMIEIRAVTNLKSSQARLLCRIWTSAPDQESGIQDQLTACLQSASGDRHWRLRSGVMTIGREGSCHIHLDSPEIQQKKLVSGVHAYISCQKNSFRLFDGSPDGRPSLNGTFVNLQRVPPGGLELKDGDQILLATLKPDLPNPDLPGAATLFFHQDCT